MELNISNIDIVVILLFVVGIIWWALKNRKNENASEYFLAGKSQNWFVVGSSLFAASVSSSTLMGHSGEGFISGIAVFNYNVGAIFVIIFVSLFFLPFYIKSGIYTIPEYLGRRFDNRSRKYFSFITIIGNVFLDAGAALYTGALILKIIFPEIDMMWIIIGMALMAGTYTIIGGLSSAINADMIQSIILIAGSVLLSIFCFNSVGGWENFVEHFHDGVWLNLIRPNSDTTVPWFSIFLSIPILGFYFWGNNQVIVQRVMSAKTVNEGRLGFLFVAFLYVFTLFIFIAPGMVGRMIDLFGVGDTLPNEIIDGNTLRAQYGIDTNEVYPRLILKLLPVGLIGVMIACMVSALTSTLSATLSSVSTLFTMDFYKTFLVGLFWKGSTRNGAFAGLMSGLAMSALIMTYKFGFGGVVPFHFLLWVPILLILSVLVNIIVSKCDRNKETDVETYTWNKSVWQDDTRELKTVPWYKNFRYISIALIIIALLEYWWFF